MAGGSVHGDWRDCDFRRFLFLVYQAARSPFEPEPVDERGARAGGKDMLNRLSTPRQMRIGLLGALLALSVAAGAWAQDADDEAKSSPPSATPTAQTPAGQKGGAGRGAAANAPSAAEQHRLPPDSTTKQTLALPGRTLDFTGDRRLDPPVRRQGRAAGRHRLYRLPARWRRPRHPSGDVPVQWRAGRVLGLAAARRCRPVAALDQRRWRGGLRLARSPAQCRDLARLHRSRLHRSRRHRL